MKSSNGHIRVIEESCYQWRYIGIHLNLTSSHLSSIDAENGHNITRAMRDVYSTWMERDIDSSWQKLIKCFKRVELHRLARRLEQHIGMLYSMFPQLDAGRKGGYGGSI